MKNLTFLLMACSENLIIEKVTLNPNIQIVPDHIYFDDTSVLNNQVSSETFWVINSGGETLNVSLIENSTIFDFSEYNFSIEPQEEIELQASFAPNYFYQYDYIGVAESNDPETPELPIKLSGLGLSPAIEVSESVYNFEVNIGCVEVQEFIIKNIGNETLTVDNILNYESALSDISLDVDIANNGDFPWYIEPFDSKSFYAKYEPLDMIDDNNKVLIPNNDPFINSDKEVEINGIGIVTDEYSQTFLPPETGLLDLIFVVDNSGSMNTLQTQMMNNISNITSIFSNANIDYKIGIITTSSSNFVGQVITVYSTNPSSLLYNNFSIIGTSGGGTEKGLEKIHQSLTSGQAYATNFLREDATLAIIFLSDEKDQSPLNWSFYAYEIQALKRSPTMIKAFPIVGDFPAGCNYNGREIEFGMGYYEFGNYFYGSNISICSNWGSQIDNIMWTLACDDTFDLDYKPVLDSILVYKNGVLIPDTEWTYNSSENSISVIGITVDDTIEIKYYPLDCQ